MLLYLKIGILRSVLQMHLPISWWQVFLELKKGLTSTHNSSWSFYSHETHHFHVCWASVIFRKCAPQASQSKETKRQTSRYPQQRLECEWANEWSDQMSEANKWAKRVKWEGKGEASKLSKASKLSEASKWAKLANEQSKFKPFKYLIKIPWANQIKKVAHPKVPRG